MNLRRIYNIQLTCSKTIKISAFILPQYYEKLEDLLMTDVEST
jgi:hypothetical protein